MTNTIVNALTIDVEDYFQVAAFDQCIDRRNWTAMECRVERNVERLLSILSSCDAKATFFTLGWIAERYPDMVKKIASGGHEIASHGYNHQKATTQNPDEFKEDLLRAKGILQDTTGQSIRGYRAPSFSIGRDNLWAHDALLETGHEYSSSIYPVRHDHYGMLEAPRFAYTTDSGLLEIPLSTARIFGNNVPAAGGGYFRLLPYAASRWMINQINQRDHQSAVFYCHPWEIDPDQPKISQASAKSRFRHYINLNRMENRLIRLANDFRWDRVDQVFESLLLDSSKAFDVSEIVYEP